MRSSALLNFTHTARILSHRRLVRVQLKAQVPGLGQAGSIVLVHPGRMRNELLPTKKAIYQPLPTPFQLSHQKTNASILEAQLESAQAQLEIQQAREWLSKKLGPIQLLSLRRKLEAAPAVVFARQTTTKFKPSSSSVPGQLDLPKPALGIQGSISTADIVDFLRDNGAFDLETDIIEEGHDVQLNRLTLSQINTACEFTLSSATENTNDDSIDKLGRIKKTGRYILVAHILPSNIRVRIPVVVRPNTTSTQASTSTLAATPSASTPSSTTMSAAATPAGQTRGYATSVKPPTAMETSMRSKLEAEFGPEVEVNIRNDSSKHAHHAAMAAQGGGNGETHFFVHVISDKFQGMTQIKRHRAINALLQAEFDRGLHALSLRTKTWAEENRSKPSTTSDASSETGQQETTTIDDPTTCPQDDTLSSSPSSSASVGEEASGRGSLWTAPQSHLYPTSPLASRPTSTSISSSSSSAAAPSSAEMDILSAFYTRPPSGSALPSTAAVKRVTPGQREKFFRRATKNDALEPSNRQNLLNVLGGILAAVSGTYMVLFADFGQPEAAENCFTDLRKLVWGPQGPPKLF